jgi:hypothetical protein
MKRTCAYAAEIIGVVVLAGLAILAWTRVLPPPETRTSELPKVLYTTTPVQEDTPYARMRGEYPQFPLASEAFNGKIRETVRTAMAEHASDAAENWKARYQFGSSTDGVTEFPPEGQTLDLVVRWTPELVDERYVSFVMRYGGYTGGAHGYEEVRTFNYSIACQCDLSLADLFPNDPNYLTTVSERARSLLRERLIGSIDDAEAATFAEGMLTAGTEPTEENFRHFTFNDTQVVIYFERYQVAPGASGEQSIVVPR